MEIALAPVGATRLLVPFRLSVVSILANAPRVCPEGRPEGREGFRQFRSHLENPNLRVGFPCGLAANQDAGA
jgi:hypothetical protein